ncbi:hypothetical protein IQ07DRAFT_238276 [Pyrenochaeta sp. DS3sAY3a]|nr:hypothetical protein IQ07DRAFT_238276 [Pyrenochaeta sp. DS3sAY3a]
MAGLGDISEMGDSEQIGRDALEQPEDKADFYPELVKLVAGAFYFRRVGGARIRSDGTCLCTGQICCEFTNGSLIFWVFWDYFGKQLKNHSKICFDIESDTEESQVITPPISITCRKTPFR